MLKEKYKHMSDQISPSPELVENLLRTARAEAEKKMTDQERQKTVAGRPYAKAGKQKRTRKHVLGKPAILLAAVAICIFAAMPALAASVPQIYDLMYQVSPSAAQFFMPVQKSCEDKGIDMEVISAYIHGNTAEIYITMQDLTGDRLDETTDLFDSYDINRPFDSIGHCERVGYDAETKTATFLITISEFGDRDITGDKITFSVREFLSGKQYFEEVEIPVDLTKVQEAASTQDVYLTGSGGNYASYIEDPTEAKVLVPAASMEEFPIEGIEMTGIGYIDGRLHIQNAYPNRLENDNHGYFYLKDAAGNQINCSYNLYFAENLNVDDADRLDYCEMIFDIPKEEVKNYELYGYYVTSGTLTKGDWRVTFPIERAK